MQAGELWPGNPKCARTFASFRLGSDELIPDEVTAATGLEPSFAAAKGSLVGKQQRVQRTGVWSISSEESIDSTNLERHIVFLLDMIEPVAGELTAVASRFGASMDFFCYWRAKTGDGGPVFSPDTLGRIAAIGAVLGLDFYPAV